MTETAVEKFLNSDREEQSRFAKLLLRDDEEFKDGMKTAVKLRRKDIASTITTDSSDVMSEDEAEKLIKEREDSVLEDWNSIEGIDLPDWFLRIEAQDMIEKLIYQRLKEQDVI